MKKIIFVALSLLLSAQSPAVTLINETEANLPDSKNVELKTRAITRGPAIRAVAPAPATAVKSPFDLKVVFEPRGGATIDLSSVKVIYLKSPAIDLVERIKPGLSERGIDLSKAEVPVGEHHIGISLQDSEGRESRSVIRLNVTQ